MEEDNNEVATVNDKTYVNGSRVFIGGHKQDMEDAVKIVYSDQFIGQIPEFCDKVEDVIEDWLLKEEMMEAYLDADLDALVRARIICFNEFVCNTIRELQFLASDAKDCRKTLNEG